MSTNNDNKGSKRANSEHRRDSIDLSNDQDSHSAVIDLTGSDDEDEDLKRAIALSLQDQSSFQPSRTQENLNASTETMSKSLVDDPQCPPDTHVGHSSETRSSSILSLDRKQMEIERLARLKRKREPSLVNRPVSPPPLQRNSRALPHQVKPMATKHPRQDQSSRSTPLEDVHPTLGMTKSSSSHIQSRYPHGKVFLTSMIKSQARSISFAKLLEPPEPETTLKAAFLSTFIVDFDWLFPHFDTRKVSFVLALHAQNDQEKVLKQNDFTDIPNVRLVFPYIGGNVNCMHSKVMLLFYANAEDLSSTTCRLVVPSANLVPWDWGVGGVMENTLFLIDLPSHDANMLSHSRKSTAFKESLVQMLEAMGAPSDVVVRLDQYDFSKTEPYRFVHSIGGSHLLPTKSTTGENASIKGFLTHPRDATKPTMVASDSNRSVKTGKICLSDAVSSLGLCVQPDDVSYPPRIDFITSSLGNLNEPFLRSLFLAVCGRVPTAPEKATKVVKTLDARVKQHKEDEKLDLVTLTDNVGIYFPSDRTVRNSRGGPASAGTICFQSKWWDAPGSKFPRNMISDCVGVRKDKILMHSKVLFVRYANPKEVVLSEALHHDHNSVSVGTTHAARSEPLSSANKFAGWAYIGSANLSESAWGSLVTDSKTKQPKMNCRNWESGVLIPIPAKPEHEGRNLRDLTLEEVFGDIIPVPIEYPSVNLVENERRPWFFHG